MKPLAVTLVGPLPPLRGGIAQHTASLRSALDRRTRLLTIPFTRLYPHWLFPGKSVHEPGRDDADEPGAPKVLTIDALRPRTWGRVIAASLDHGSDVVVMPWWTVALAPSLRTIGAQSSRAGLAVTFLCHNVVDHEGAWWKRSLTRFVLSTGSRFIVSSSAERETLLSFRPDADVIVHPHPVYRHLPDSPSLLPRRGNPELLFFGLIRRYKGLDVLIEALAKLPSMSWHLTIAGEPWEDLGPLRRRISEAGIVERVEWIERYVSAEEAAALFQRADAVMLPYRHATGCGVLALALGEGKAVVASDLPGLREQVVDGETGWLVPPEDSDALADALKHVDQSTTAAMVEAVREEARRWTWDSLAEAVLGSDAG